MAFDISALTTAFHDQLEGGEFYNRVAEGTLANFFQTYAVRNKGTQQLNVNRANLTFDINVDGDIDAYDNYNSDLDFGRRTLNVDGMAAQGYITNRELYGSYAAVDGNSGDDETVARRFVDNIMAQTSFQYAQSIYTGFGIGTPTNGLLDASTNLNVGTGAITAGNIVQKLTDLISGFLAISGNNALENAGDIAIIMTPAHYRLLRQAYRTFNYFDTGLVNETGMMMSPWLDDSRITIYGDPAFTGQPVITATDSVYVGVPTLTDLDNVEFWYNPDKKAVGFRIEIWGGVQVLEANHLRTANNA